MLAATPLTIHFFFKPHLRELTRYFDTTLVFNAHADTYLPPLDLSLQQVHVAMERKIAPWSDLLALLSLCRFFRRERFDMVVSVVPKAGLLGMMAAFLMRVPRRVHIFQGEVWASRRGLMRFLLKLMDILTARLATHVLAVSKSEIHFLEQQGVVPHGKAQVLGSGSICGVDIDRFKPDALARTRARNELAVSDDAVLCVFLGRLTEDKGILDLVRAFAISAPNRPKLMLLIVGPDEEKMMARLNQLIPPELAIRVLIKGFSSNPERWLAASDFLCLPSYREGFGMVILEAAAVGLSAIGTRIYGITDAIEEGETGQLVTVGDVQALSSAINLWVDDPLQRNQFAASAYVRARSEFEQCMVIDRYVKYFTQVVSSE